MSNAVERAKELEDACSNVEVSYLNAGHCPHDEVPHLVNQGLLDFVQRISESDEANLDVQQQNAAAVHSV